MKHGIFYGSRPLPGGKFGIVIATYIKGKWIETDLNKTPWPSAAVALDRAKGHAEARAFDEKLPVAPIAFSAKAWARAES